MFGGFRFSGKNYDPLDGFAESPITVKSGAQANLMIVGSDNEFAFVGPTIHVEKGGSLVISGKGMLIIHQALMSLDSAGIGGAG